MSDHPCSCGSCPHEGVPDVTDSCPGEWICGVDGTQMSDVTRAYIALEGCLSHPQAREHMNKEVIEELEDRIKLISNAREHNMNLSGGHLSISLYTDSIQLPKEGVKKKEPREHHATVDSAGNDMSNSIPVSGPRGMIGSERGVKG